MNKTEMFEDFKLITKMYASEKCKAGMITYLFLSDPERWRVTGITKDALIRLKEYDFKKTTGIKLHRAHKHSRYNTYVGMLSKEFKNSDEWWQFYYEHDETIIATSSENATGNYSKIFAVDSSIGLFKTSGYSFTHKKFEIDFLKRLHSQHLRD